MLLFALVLAALCLASAHGASVRAADSVAVQQRATVRSDVLGVYSLHPSSKDVARPFNCPDKITTVTFEFRVTNSPSTLEAPPAFNIIIPHVVTLLDDRQCESSGNVVATTSDHPFVEVESSPLDVITYWAGGGTTQNATWVTEELVDAVSRQSFVVGYDFAERSCRGVRLRAGTAFLWFQPAWDIPLGQLQLTGKNKYLLLTFRFQTRAGCIYVADVVGGEGDFSVGPVSDPSLEAASEDANMLPVLPTLGPAPAADTDSDLLPSDEEEHVDDDDDDDDNDNDNGNDDDDGDDHSDPSLDASDQTETSSPSSDSQDSTESSQSEDADPSGPTGGNVFGGASGESSDTDTSLQPDSQREGPACFSGSSVVELEHGSNLQMRNLQIGHRVRVGQKHFSDVFFFSHRLEQEDALHDFVRIRTEHAHILTLSEGHYVYVNGRMCAAGAVSNGDRLETADGGWTRIASIEHVQEQGLYAPHTFDGDIVVDGIRASTYTTAVHPRLAHHVLLAPVRLLYRLGVRGVWDRVIDAGVRDLHHFLPRGPRQFESA